MVPKKYHLNIINDSVKFQKEILKSRLLFIYSMLWLKPESTSHINPTSVIITLAFKKTELRI